jgi:surface polysaccharide O-acyltransferase-like enzyme
MEHNPGYFSEIVYLRAFAILAVISIHESEYFFTEMSGINFLTFLYMSIDTFSKCAVPLFVGISGFVLYNKYRGSYSLRIFYKKRFLSVVPQYTLFSLLAMLFVYIGRMFLGRVWNYNATDILYQYFTGGALYHLWFFILIIQLYILYPLIEKIFTKSIEKANAPYLLVFLFIVQLAYYLFFPADIFLKGTVLLFLPYVLYFVLGMYARTYYDRVKNGVTVVQKHPYGVSAGLLCATTVGIGATYIRYFGHDLLFGIPSLTSWIDAIITPWYFIVIFTMGVFIALKISEMVPSGSTRLLHVIGSYSMGIFLIHAFILYALESVLFIKLGFDVNNWLFFPVVFALVLGLSLVFVYLMNKVPYHEYIIGSSR